MKMRFADPELKVIRFEAKDVLTSSIVPGGNETPIMDEDDDG